ncbi:MAG: hypothetical protein KGN76_04225 [Acidobacteriota bacterium]|nr:hypothetical protein [Acidobacteriota bacterium]
MRLAAIGLAVVIAASSPGPGAAGQATTAPAAHDGAHDFDFAFGRWHAVLKILQHPLSGSHTWIDYEGTTTVRKIWGGKANMAELEITSAATHAHIEGLSLRLYDPQSHQWSIYFADSKGGGLGTPMIGGFAGGRGEFYDQEPFNGRAIFVRFVFSDITQTSFHFVQSFSADGGRSWEPNWIGDFTRQGS